MKWKFISTFFFLPFVFNIVMDFEINHVSDRLLASVVGAVECRRYSGFNLLSWRSWATRQDWGVRQTYGSPSAVTLCHSTAIKNFFLLFCNLNLLSLRDFNLISYPMSVTLFASSSLLHSRFDSQKAYLTLLSFGLRRIFSAVTLEASSHYLCMYLFPILHHPKSPLLLSTCHLSHSLLMFYYLLWEFFLLFTQNKSLLIQS